MMKLISVVGARPNFIKIAPIIRAIEKHNKSVNLSRPPSHLSPLTSYVLLTLHRPSNVDNKESLLKIVKALKEISQKIPIVFPAHPRTKKQIKRFGIENYFNFNDTLNSRINCIDPLGYLDFLNLEIHAKFVMTDSGGMQEETTVLSIPCLTLI